MADKNFRANRKKKRIIVFKPAGWKVDNTVWIKKTLNTYKHQIREGLVIADWMDRWIVFLFGNLHAIYYALEESDKADTNLSNG